MAQLELERHRHRGARDRARPDGARLRARADRFDLVQHRGRVGVGRPCGVVVRRRLQRHLPHRRGGPGALPVRRLAHHGAVRRGRRAARQGAAGERTAAAAAPHRGVRHGGAVRFRASAGHEPRCAARVGPRPSGAASPRTGGAGGRGAARGSGDPGLHLGHHRQAQGRDAPARRATFWRCARATGRARRTRPTSACASCRCATSPSAWAASSSAMYTGSMLNFVENPDTVPENVREIAPTCSPRCRGCGRSSIRR